VRQHVGEVVLRIGEAQVGERWMARPPEAA
jgi:hypothetical protein